MKQERNKSNITDLMSLVMFGVFALCVLGVLLTGAGIYRSQAERGAAASDSRTAVQYVATRVRQAEGVTVEDFGGVTALVLPEEIGGRTYLTRVYCHDGYIRELFTAGSGEFSPGDGEKILEAQAMEISLEGSLLLVRITLPDGGERELSLYLRSGEGAAA